MRLRSKINLTSIWGQAHFWAKLKFWAKPNLRLKVRPSQFWGQANGARPGQVLEYASDIFFPILQCNFYLYVNMFKEKHYYCIVKYLIRVIYNYEIRRENNVNLSCCPNLKISISASREKRIYQGALPQVEQHVPYCISENGSK